MKKRLIHIGVALSQLLHTLITFGEGDPKMTTSARIGRQVARGERWAIVACWIISSLLFDHPDHCLRSYRRDQDRRLCGGHHDQ